MGEDSRMPYRIRALDEAVGRSRREVTALGLELRNARMTCGPTQSEVARALGWSASKVRRIELGQRRSVTHLELASFATVVGLSYSGKLFMGRTRLRDATQLEMVNGYRFALTAWGWQCRIEEPMPLTGDLRAFDLMVRTDDHRVAHEFVSRLRDIQAQIRPLLQKQRDAGIRSLILVIRDTTENRRAVLGAGEALRDPFPMSARAVLRAMRERRDPGGNGIVFWRQPPGAAAPGPPATRRSQPGRPSGHTASAAQRRYR